MYCLVYVRRFPKPSRSMHFGAHFCSDLVTGNALTARKNEAQGLDKQMYKPRSFSHVMEKFHTHVYTSFFKPPIVTGHFAPRYTQLPIFKSFRAIQIVANQSWSLTRISSGKRPHAVAFESFRNSSIIHKELRSLSKNHQRSVQFHQNVDLGVVVYWCSKTKEKSCWVNQKVVAVVYESFSQRWW